MSNTAVGSVYERIIEDVISASRVDFEENGVDEGVLDDLRKGWQNKLSQFKVAQFPWDPKPDPEDASGNSPGGNRASNDVVPSPAAPISANTSFSLPTMSPMASSQVVPPLPMPAFEQTSIKSEDDGAAGHGIKLEPSDASDLAANAMPFPAMAGGGGGAAARAMQQLQNTFGQRAAASINAIHSGMGQQPNQPNAAAASQQQLNNAQRAATAEQYRQMNGAGAAGGLPNSQVDGSHDSGLEAAEAPFEGVLLQQQRAGEAPVELGRVAIDNLLHAQIAARARQMEGGGLMLTLQSRDQDRARDRARVRARVRDQARAGSSRMRKTDARAAEATAEATPSTAADGAAPQQGRATAAGRMAQVDGGGDDDDDKDGILDEDAINSDLDDPEDNKDDDDDDDDAMSPIMLCVYDKVQRVKNKWKCTLKDGVLTVNGKEYVFHKATGEYEW